MSEKINKIFSLFARLNITYSQHQKLLKNKYGVNNCLQISEWQADDLIRFLESLISVKSFITI
jgi:hypothetical protein